MDGAEGGRKWKREGAEGTGQGGRRAQRVEWELASVSAVLRESSRSQQGIWRPPKATESCLVCFTFRVVLCLEESCKDGTRSLGPPHLVPPCLHPPLCPCALLSALQTLSAHH